MPIDLLCDGHIHTSFCRHAEGTMEEYVLSAIDKGLRQIFFLEHMEEGIASPRVTWLSEAEFDSYFAQGKKLQEQYAAKISIGLGVEVGYNPECKERLLNRLAKRTWDRIGISYHFHRLAAGSDHFNLVSKSDSRVYHLSVEEAAQIEKAYYRNLTEAVAILPGTVLCHLDGVLRYYPGRDLLEPPRLLIDKLLEKVKERGMAIELNTSGFAIRGESFPAKDIIAMAIAKNIPLQCASDAHRPSEIGRYFTRLDSHQVKE